MRSNGGETDLTEVPDIINGRVWRGAFVRAGRNGIIREWAGRERELRQRRPQVAAEVTAVRAAGDADRTGFEGLARELRIRVLPR